LKKKEILANSILEECVNSWGKRSSSYYVTEKEILTFINAGALIKEKLFPGDGTFIITVEYKEHMFACSTIDKKIIALLSK